MILSSRLGCTIAVTLRFALVNGHRPLRDDAAAPAQGADDAVPAINVCLGIGEALVNRLATTSSTRNLRLRNLADALQVIERSIKLLLRLG